MFEWSGNAVLWRGLPSFQLPSDLFAYARLIHETQPDFIIETGSGDGGTTQFLRDVCQLEAHGTVIGISKDSLAWAKSAGLEGSVMAILDSDVYSAKHMRDELEAFAPLVTRGQHLIVCHTDRADWGSGVALTSYLSEHGAEFEQSPEPVPTLNPGGYLRRIV